MRSTFKYLRLLLPVAVLAMAPLAAQHHEESGHHDVPKHHDTERFYETGNPDAHNKHYEESYKHHDMGADKPITPHHDESDKHHYSDKHNEPVKATLMSESASVKPGQPFWVGVELQMSPGWDTYWMYPGDAGLPTQIEWKLPKGFTAGPIQWPYPEKITDGSMVGYGYTGSVMLLTKITPPKNFKGSSIDLGANVTWLACKDACMPGNAELNLSLPVGVGETNSQVAQQFADAKARLPMRSPSKVTAKVNKGQIALNVPGARDVESAVFYPAQSDVINNNAPQQMQLDQGGITLNLEPGSTQAGSMQGVLVLSQKGSPDKMVYQVDAKIREIAKAHLSGGLGMALVLAFFGGLILNVMPCVLPVIALKIFSFVKMAGERRREILKHGSVFTLGVLVSFWVLSGALLLLRSFGQSVGWGFQLQEPLFVAVMIGVLFLLGLSLFGVFELGTSMISLGSKTQVKSSPFLSSFMGGVLATLVATPCTGPLLGPALGYAMTLPSVLSLSIFTVMGLGMASPYLLFSAFPKLVRFLPKPGNWMITFKQIMGFLMMATVVWLVWVFASQVGHIALLVMLLSLVVAGVGAWIYGQWGTPLKKKSTRTVATVIAALLLGVAGMGTVKATHKFPALTQTESMENGWENYSPDKVAQMRAEGKPVFVDFTAKWCLICQANKVVLHNADITKEFQQKGVVTMSADWTRKDAVITKQLEKLGRTGVPVYVLYPAHDGDPVILPQTLTSKVMHDYLDKLPNAH